jgi:steroid 5-alpha reductase family enzyme
MRFNKKDTAATLIVAAILIPYVGYLTRGSMPFIQDARGMAATGLILLLAWGVLVRTPFGEGSIAWIAGAIGVAAVGFGIAALWAESDMLLVPFMATIVVLWAIRMSIHFEETRQMGSRWLTHP